MNTHPVLPAVSWFEALCALLCALILGVLGILFVVWICGGG